MSQPQPSPDSEDSAEADLPFTTGMRIFGGVAWGTLSTISIAVILIVLPQVPRSWLWGILPSWVALVSLGIVLQWSTARGSCPKCGRPLVVSPMGKRCPQCRSYLKAVNRTIVKVA
jgi:energy-coupling factor transporter transmembrane protein EcfT